MKSASFNVRTDRLKSIIEKYYLYRHPGGRIFAFPSGKGGVGKTLISLNLGAALAKNSKVAVVDINFALPNLHSYIGQLPGRTITHYLAGFCEIEDILPVKIDIGAGLEVYTSRSIVNLSKPPKLERLIPLFKWMKGRYNYILLDMPPGASRYSIYPAILSDAVFIITTDEKAAYLDATEIKRKLEHYGAYVAGMIVNRCKKKPKYFKEGEVTGTVPTDESLRKFPKIWKRKFLKPRGVRSLEELARKIVEIMD